MNQISFVLTLIERMKDGNELEDLKIGKLED
jgi:hypothetical protein